MLTEWLEVDSSANWKRLLKVLESPQVSGDQTLDKGSQYDNKCCIYVLLLYEICLHRYLSFPILFTLL